MPEYLHPGVYVVEIASNARPIEGVSTSTAGFVGRDMMAMLQQFRALWAPDWADNNTHDPGVAVVELLAYTAESLLYRAEQLPERGQLHAARLAAAALALVTACDQPHGSVLKRVRFFEGRTLDADDLRTEQEYTRPGAT